jgi:hypothetical protein
MQDLLSGLTTPQQLLFLRLVARPLDPGLLSALPLLTDLVELCVDFLSDPANPSPTLGEGKYADIELPQLVWLNVSGPARASPLLSCSYWHMPRLLHLVVTVTGGTDDYTLDGLSRLGSSLHSLQFYGWFQLPDKVGLDVLCPHLRSLTMDAVENCFKLKGHPTIEEIIIHDANWGLEYGLNHFYIFVTRIVGERYLWPKLSKIVDLSWPWPAPVDEPYLIWWGMGTVLSLRSQGVDCVGWNGSDIPDTAS